MGVPGFYSWLTKRYPLIKHMVGKETLPEIDYLYLDMNGIIYKCVKDDSVIFKSQILPKEFEEIWTEIFNYINMIVNLLKPTKTIFLALDGVAPRSKMNNQRSRRFKSARDYKEFIEKFYGYQDQQGSESSENFKNNSISPGTKFMEELNEMIHFFVQKKIQQDDYWKNLSIIFTGSDCPGQGEHKIMQWIRSNKQKFNPDDSHCLYGADADLIMLGLTLPLKNISIIRQEYIHGHGGVKIKDSKKQKVVQFEMIFLGILKEYFDIEYRQIKDQMKNLEYSVTKVIRDFVLLFFFIGNDFLPRCLAYNIRQRSIEKLIIGFKTFLCSAEDYVVGENGINLKELARLTSQVAKFEAVFIQEKAEDAQKFLQKKNQFEDQFTEAMKQKVLKESQFLIQLKQYYMNQDDSVRNGFYKDKFGVNPVENTQKFYEILHNYLVGIKFVHEYYFMNLSSWSWYYPYYYAPFLSDMSLYLNFLVESETTLAELQRGEPFRPFKQLLCILPKQSAQLLPESFQSFLKNPESILRSPKDYYPDTFDDDLYGSVRSYQAVSLIPFLDQRIITQAYDEGMKGVTQAREERRNRFGKTILYEYNAKTDKIDVKSPLSGIESFSCRIVRQQIDLLEGCTWKTSAKVQPNLQTQANESVLYRMPSLNMREHEASLYDDHKKVVKYQLEVTQTEQINRKQASSIKLSSTVFYGYPLEHSGRVQGILTKQHLQKNPEFDPYNYKLGRISDDYTEIHSLVKLTKHLFQDLVEEAQKKFNYLDLSQTETLLFVIDTQYFNRTLQGGFDRAYINQNADRSYEIVPLALVSKDRKYLTTKCDFKFKSLKEQFPLDQEVLLAHPDIKLCGSKGRVIGYEEKSNCLKVQITHPLKKLNNQKLFKIVNTDEVFMDLRFVSEIIGFKFDIILTILDTVSIELPRQKNLPQSIDIGLNFISRQDEKLVPNLVRLNFENKALSNEDPKRKYKFLELSVKAFEMLLEYRKKYHEVLDFIQARHHKLIDEAKKNQKPINWREKMNAEEIFALDGNTQGKHKEITKQLMKVYLWLIKNKQTHMPMSSIYSKQISYKKIAKLQDYFKTQFSGKIKLSEQERALKGKKIDIDPNFLYSLDLSRKGFLYLAKRPDDHVVGDQVVCLHPEHFGHFGVIIGVDDDRYQVVFSRPSFGKNDLGGLCSNLWGGKFRYKQLMNLELWPEHFQPRASTKSRLQNSGWIDKMKAFSPKFRTKPIKNFNDFELFIKNKQLAKIFQQSSIQYILNIKAKLKQVPLQKDFQIVDNAKQDYKYKYDNKQTTVSEKEVEDLGKNKKWVEKSIGADVIKNQDFEKEVIENKLQKLDINNQTEQEIELEVEDESVFRDEEKNMIKQKGVARPVPVQPKKIKYEEKKPKVIKYQEPAKEKSEQPVQTQPAKKQEPKTMQQPNPKQEPKKEQDPFGQEQDADDILG